MLGRMTLLLFLWIPSVWAQKGVDKRILYYDSLAIQHRDKAPDSTLKYLKKGLEIAKTVRDSENIAYFSNFLGVAYKRISKYDTAVYWYNEALFWNKKIRHKGGEGGVYNNLGFIYKIQGKYLLALKSYFNALTLAQETQNGKSETIILNNIGNVFADLNNLTYALQYYEQALSVALKIKDDANGSSTYNNIGNIYLKQKQYDKAESCYRNALTLKKKLGKPLILASGYGNLGRLYQHKKQYDSALIYLQQASTLYKNVKDKNGEASSYLEIAETLVLQGKTSEALTYYEQALQISQQIGSKLSAQQAYLYLSKQYQNKKQFEKSLHYLFHYVSLKDSLTTQELSTQLNELSEKYQTKQKQFMIDSLYQANKIQEIEKNNAKWYRNIFLGLLLGLGLAVTFLLYLYRLKQQHNKVLAEKNVIIEESMRRQELLLKEIHHRVKNNLQIISSLLNLQANYAMDKSLEDVIKDSQDRIYAMSIIHEKLYQSNNLETIDLQEYVEKLMVYFNQTYNLSERQIELQLNVTPLFLDVDALIPCGLILNELITNSIKYAFEPNQQGIISIWSELKNNQYSLTIADNGKGLPKTFSLHQSKSLGMRLVQGFTQQMKGTLEYHSHEGTTFVLSFAVAG